MKKSITYRVLSNSLAFIIGFSIVFILIGTIAGSFQQVYQEYKIFRVMGVIVFILGIHMTGIFRIKSLMQEKKFHLSGNKWGLAGSTLVGMIFAFGWTPCVGPILAAIFTLAVDSSTKSSAVILMIAYSLGLAIPFFIAALALNQFLKWFNKFRNYLRVVEILSGILVMAVGVLIFMDMMSKLNSVFATGTGSIESNVSGKLIGDVDSVNIFIAFIGGLISFLSPCVLPMIPMYLSYLSGASIGDMVGESKPKPSPPTTDT
jgi:cytochrome c-type biogenesis protein